MLLLINFLLGFQKVLDLFHRQITVLFLLLLDLQRGLQLTRTVTCVSFVFWWTGRCEVLTLSSICWNLRAQHSLAKGYYILNSIITQHATAPQCVIHDQDSE